MNDLEEKEESNPLAVTDIVSVEKSVEQAEKYFNVLARIRSASIRLTNNLDWSNQGGKPYLEKSGCDKIASAFGVKITEFEFEKEALTDDRGDYVMYTCKASGVWNNTTASEAGTASSRDDFFAKTTNKETGEKGLKPLSEVDLTDVKKKALTNCMNRLVKRLLGLSFTWDEIQEISKGQITAQKVSTVDFNKGGKGGNMDSPETKKKRDQIRQWLLMLCLDNEDEAKKMLVGMTAFTIDGKDIPGKQSTAQLSEKQVNMLYPKIEKQVNAMLDAQADAKGGKE